MVYATGAQYAITWLFSYWLLVFVRSGRKCSGPGSVTALIYSGQNRTRHRIFAFVILLFW